MFKVSVRGAQIEVIRLLANVPVTCWCAPGFTTSASASGFFCRLKCASEHQVVGGFIIEPATIVFLMSQRGVIVANVKDIIEVLGGEDMIEKMVFGQG